MDPVNSVTYSPLRFAAEGANENGESLSVAQYVGIVAACLLGCTLSIIGSAIILYCSRYKLSNLYHRILAILSVFDILNSITWALHPFVFNAEGTPGLFWANGNFHTCTAGGFLSVGEYKYCTFKNSACVSNLYFHLSIFYY